MDLRRSVSREQVLLLLRAQGLLPELPGRTPFISLRELRPVSPPADLTLTRC